MRSGFHSGPASVAAVAPRPETGGLLLRRSSPAAVLVLLRAAAAYETLRNGDPSPKSCFLKCPRMTVQPYIEGRLPIEGLSETPFGED